MNNKDRDALTALIKQTKTIYSSISHQIHWSAADSVYLDDFMHTKELPRDISNRIIKATGSRALTEYVPSFLAYKAWQRTKAVYSFTTELVEALSQTADSSIYISLLERLPFKDMLFFFPEEVLSMPNGEEIAGIYVHLESHPENLWIVFNCLDRTPQSNSQVLPGIGIGFPITNGMKISEVFETPQFLEWLSSYKRTLLYFNQLDEQKIDDLILAEKKALNAAINLLYYLSAKNADIKAVKRTKKQHKTSSSPKDDTIPAIQHFEVGTQYAEIVYRHLDEDAGSAEDDDKTDEDSAVRTKKSGKKRRPHARRAHWQHYWTGEGRTKLELRWKSDLFVGAKRDDQAVIVYDVPKETKKGKRNPNTSKKKRDKQTNSR